jgi:hypothetical protein
MAVVKIADHFEHKGPGRTIAIMPCSTGGWLIPVPSGPDGAVWRKRNVLCDVAPAIVLSVKAPHGDNAIVALILAMIGTPGMVHMHGVDAPGEGKLLEGPGELAQGKTMKWYRHSNLLWRMVPWPKQTTAASSVVCLGVCIVIGLAAAALPVMFSH